MSDPTRLNALESCLREVQADEWHRLADAIARGFSPLRPSIEAENAARRVRQQATLVGPTPWDEVPWEVYVSGLYGAVLTGIPWTPPAKARINSTAMTMQRHHHPALVMRCGNIARHFEKNGFTA